MLESDTTASLTTLKALRSAVGEIEWDTIITDSAVIRTRPRSVQRIISLTSVCKSGDARCRGCPLIG